MQCMRSMLGWHYALSRHDYRCKAGYLECLCMMLCANYQGLNPNALVSSGLSPFFSPEGANLVTLASPFRVTQHSRGREGR